MTSISIVDMLTTIYVVVDDWCQAQTKPERTKVVGAKMKFKDSEMLTLMVAQDFIPYPAERQYVAYLRANHSQEFRALPSQSQYNRRARALGYQLERLRRAWLMALALVAPAQLILDTKPVPVIGYTHSKKHSAFAGHAAVGYCAARQLSYFGHKLVMLTTLDGLPLVYDVVAANLDERVAAEVVLNRVRDCDILADKGFIGADWQAHICQASANRVWTAKRANQVIQNPPAFDHLLKHLRERIEGTFHLLQNTGRNLERLLAKTVQGLPTRLIAKVASLTLKTLLRRRFGIDLQSFSTI